MTKPHTQSASIPSPIDVVSTRMPAVVALLIGSFLILGVGFAPISAVHNAAHDSRHSFAFPCH
jgi:cobalt transporter subunit CbtB